MRHGAACVCVAPGVVVAEDGFAGGKKGGGEEDVS